MRFAEGTVTVPLMAIAFDKAHSRWGSIPQSCKSNPNGNGLFVGLSPAFAGGCALTFVKRTG